MTTDTRVEPDVSADVLAGDRVGLLDGQPTAGVDQDPDDAVERSVHAVEIELGALFASVRDLRRRAAASIHPTLQPAGYGLLRLLVDHGPMRASVIAEMVGVDRSAVSRLLQSLESLGLTERHPDHEDGRAYLVGLSALGEQRMRALRTDHQGILRQALRDWEPADIDRFASLLGQFNATAKTAGRR